MYVFAKNKSFIVTGLPIDPKKGYSNATGPTLQEQLNLKNQELATAQANYARISGDIVAIQGYINGTLIPQGNLAEAGVQSAKIETILVPQRIATSVIIDGLKVDIENLKLAIKNELDAQIAANTLALSNANLTPSERIQLEKQAAELQAQKLKADSRSKNIKIGIIVTSILALVSIVGVIIYRLKKGTKASA